MANTNFKKGLELENEFAQYMKDELKYDNVRIRASVHGSINAKGTEVDILGIRQDIRGKNLQNLAIFYSTLFVILLAVGIYYDIEWVLVASIMLEVGVLVAFILSRIYNVEHAWVECKNLKTNVNINHVSKTIREIEDYKRSGNKEYKLNEFFFVSANGFVENALKLAVQNKIRCFEKQKNKFVELKYWN